LKKNRPIKKSRWIILAIAFILPLLFAVPRIYKLVFSLHEDYRLQKSLVILRAENEVRRLRIDEYKKGSVLEAKARDDLGMIKKGEKVFLIKTGSGGR
jgi:cell division protein FtsB